MTTTPTPTARASLNTLVAAEVRAEMGRRGMVNARLARSLGVSEAWTTRRLSLKSADTPISLSDLERIAEVLEVPALQLLTEAVRSGQSREAGRLSGGAGLNASLRHFAEADPEPSPEPPRRHIATRPFSPPRRDPSRPVSAIPATKRRPGPVRPGNRLMTVRA